MVKQVTQSIFLVTLSSVASICHGQSSAVLPANPTMNAAAQPSGENGRVVRDPVSGRTFYQQWITETVPATRWENKQVTTTVYETQWVNQIIPTTQTTYQPQTQYVPKPYWKGAWNPFARPTLAYKYEPVVTWAPQATTVNQIIPRQQVVPKQQTITVPQPVAETRTQQRLVQTEISQPAVSNLANSYVAPRTGYTANQPPAIFNIPLLARQPSIAATNYRISPTSPSYSGTSNPSSALASSTGGWTAPASSTQFTAAPTSGLRPVSKMIQSILPPSNYSAPLRTATAQGGNWNRMQAGMQPTVLR